MVVRFIACVTVLTTTAAVAHAAPSGREILKRQEESMRLATLSSKATLSTGDGGDTLRKKTFTWWRKLAADGVRYSTLTRFSAPATIRNEGILLRERAGGDNDVLLYLPSFKKVRRVEARSQSSSFMGSVFSYSDVASPHADDYEAKVLREEKCDKGERRCWVLELLPASEKVKAATGYARTIAWVRQDNYLTVRGEYFDKKGELWKRLEASEIREVAKKRWLAHRVQIEDVKTKRVTVLELGDVKTNVDLPDSMFTEQNLASER